MKNANYCQNTAELIARFEREHEEIEKAQEADQRNRDKLALKSAFETSRRSPPDTRIAAGMEKF